MLIGTGRGTELTGQSSSRCCLLGRIDVPKNGAIADLTRSGPGPGRCARPSRSTPSRSPNPPERRTPAGAAQCSQDRGNLRLDTIPRRPCRHAIDVTSAGIPPPSTSTIVGQRPGSARSPRRWFGGTEAMARQAVPSKPEEAPAWRRPHQSRAPRRGAHAVAPSSPRRVPQNPAVSRGAVVYPGKRLRSE